MNDYKYGIQLRAEKIAEMEYGIDYYCLDQQTQHDVYLRAEVSYAEDMMSLAEGRLEA